MSDYIGFCVAKELSGQFKRTDRVQAAEVPVRDVVGVATEWIEELSHDG